MKFIQTCLFIFTALITAQSNAAITQVAPEYFETDAQVIDFEVGVSQTLPEVNGVEFQQSFLQDAKPFFFSSNGNGIFGFQGLDNVVADPYGKTYWSDIAVNFTIPVNAVGGWLGNIWNFMDSHESLVTVSVFDTNYNLLTQQSINLLGFDNSPVFFGYTSSDNIGRIEWNGQNGGFFGVDNLMFSQVSTVPNPPTWILLSTGLIAISFKQNKKRT